MEKKILKACKDHNKKALRQYLDGIEQEKVCTWQPVCKAKASQSNGIFATRSLFVCSMMVNLHSLATMKFCKETRYSQLQLKVLGQIVHVFQHGVCWGVLQRIIFSVL